MPIELKFPQPGSQRKLGIALGKISHLIASIQSDLENVSQLGFVSDRKLRNSVILDMATIDKTLP